MVYLEILWGESLKLVRLPNESEVYLPVCLEAEQDVPFGNMTVNFEALNGVWQIKDGNYILDGERVLQNGACFKLKYYTTDTDVFIYVKTMNESYLQFKVYCIGCEERVDIGKLATLVRDKENKCFYVESSKPNSLYVNGKRTNRQKLNPLDNIYVEGTKIIYMKGYIAINQRISINLQPYIKEKGKLGQTKGRKFTENENKKFSRSPRISTKLTVDPETIDSPPAPKPPRFTPFHLQVGASLSMFVVMAVSVVLRVTLGSGNPLIAWISALSVFGSAIGMVVFPKAMRRYQVRKLIKDEEKRRSRYVEYLMKKEKKLNEYEQTNAKILYKRYPDIETLAKRIAIRERELWERTPRRDGDFLDIRIGIGARECEWKIKIKEEEFSVDEDILRNEVEKLQKKFLYLDNVPLSLKLTEEPVIGIIGQRYYGIELIKSLILQLTALHSYNDVKLVFLYAEWDTSIDFARWFPHTWNNDRTLRYICNDSATTAKLFEQIAEVVAIRKDKKEKGNADEIFLPHYVVISTASELIKTEVITKESLANNNGIDDMGISFIILENTIDRLPLFCNTIIQCYKDKNTIYRENDKSNMMHNFKPDSVSDFDMSLLARKLFRTQVEEVSQDFSLPKFLTFLELYNTSSVEGLKIATRWKNAKMNLALNTNSEQNSNAKLSAPIGVSASSTFILDIHENKHGPHGLIAGTTGSGKSEFLVSFILSLAINYPPDILSFCIIDFKGGSSINTIEKLPHISGTITNLEGSQIKRSLSTLKSELLKRQKIFTKYNVKTIDKYQELYNCEKDMTPLPYLVFICDEFARLKTEEPEFMDSLISTAQIGRSLGIHLVLSTQRPTGIVDDQIRSNTNYRICLKVQDKTDSIDMLGKPDAAHLTNKGRAYVKVGNGDVYLQIQTGWSGAKYTGKHNDIAEQPTEVSLLDSVGNSVFVEGEESDVSKNSQTQLQAITEHIASMKAQRIRLWTNPLERYVYLNSFPNKNCFNGTSWGKQEETLKPVIGLVDDTDKQEQNCLLLDFWENGHIILYGMALSGKTTFIQTLVYSLAMTHTPDIINIYILDFAGQTLGYCSRLPHVGGVIFMDEDMKMKKLMKDLNGIIEERRKKLASANGRYPHIKSYAEHENETIPAILLIIHNFSSFVENYDGYEETIKNIARDGMKYGIFLVLTGTSSLSVRSRITQYIKTKICLQLLEKYDYVNLLGKTGGLTPEAVPGRGLIKLDNVKEFQTYLAIPENDDVERVKKLYTLYDKMAKAWTGAKAYEIKTIPDNYTLKNSISSNDYKTLIASKKIPIGYNTKSFKLESVDLDNIDRYLIVGATKSGKTNFLKCLVELLSKMKDVELYVFDNNERELNRISEQCKVKNYAFQKEEINSAFSNILNISKQRKAEKERKKTVSFSKLIIIENDFKHMYDMADDKADPPIDKVMEALLQKGKEYGIHHFIEESNLSLFRNEDIYKSIIGSKNGILLGGDYNKYNECFVDSGMTYKEKERSFAVGCGYSFYNGQFIEIATPLYE